MYKRLYLFAILAFLAVCATQQVWIYRLKAAPLHEARARAEPATYNIAQMAKILVPPVGAVDVANQKGSSTLSGTGFGTTGFDACLWIDTTGFGRDIRSRESGIAEIGAWYAQRVVAAIPGAYIERAVNLPQNIEARALHCYYVVRHPAGVVMVTAGYCSAREGNEISNLVKVQVSTINTEGDARHEVVMN